MADAKYNNVPTFDMPNLYGGMKLFTRLPLKRFSTKNPYMLKRRRRRGIRANLPYGKHKKLHELKFRDSIVNDAAVDPAGTITFSHVQIPQGTDEDERNGRRITVVQVNFYWQLQLPSFDFLDDAEAMTGDIVRIILFVDTQANLGSPTVLDVLETAQEQSFRNLANTKRFKFLMDKRTVLNRMTSMEQSSIHTDVGELVTFERTFNDVNIPIHYSGPLGIFSEITENNILSLYISSEGFARILNSRVRIRFYSS